jgi:simple sugar transport system permease protein
MIETLTGLIVLTLAASTPLIIAALGELVVEKSGVLNLGVEGMMLTGAVCAFIVCVKTGSPWLGVVAGAAAGALLAAIFGVLTLTLAANQVASGLALSIFGAGLSAFAGLDYVAAVVTSIKPLDIPGLTTLPIAGPLLFGHNPLVYLACALLAAVHAWLYHTRAGLVVCAIGEAPDAAHAIGYRVIAIRYACVLFGGACAGVAGAYLSLAYTPMWNENMTAGRGWIALALVVFATWKPLRVLLGALLFGGVTLAQFQVQAAGVDVAPQLLAMLPYAATIIVLAVISRNPMLILRNAPASLGRPFRVEL